MKGRLQLLRQEIRSDAAAFAMRAEELAALPLDAATADANVLARAAVALHHAYGAVEAALARLAKVFDTEPTGQNWHRSLLDSMALGVPGVRPAILGLESLAILRDLLSFRHFFRHAYAVPLDAGRIRSLADQVQKLAPRLTVELQAVDRWLQDLAAAD